MSLYGDITFALSVDADFEGWDLSLYAARVRQDQGFIDPSQEDGIRQESLPYGKDYYVKDATQ